MIIEKRHNKEIHRHERKRLSLLQSDYNQITIGLQLGYSQSHHLLHLESTQHKQPHKKKKSKKRKKKTKEKDRMKERKAR